MPLMRRQAPDHNSAMTAALLATCVPAAKLSTACLKYRGAINPATDHDLTVCEVSMVVSHMHLVLYEAITAVHGTVTRAKCIKL